MMELTILFMIIQVGASGAILILMFLHLKLATPLFGIMVGVQYEVRAQVLFLLLIPMFREAIVE